MPADHRAIDRRWSWGLLLIAGAACGSDLGEADPEAARELVYGRGGLVATKGQALVHDSCGNAAFCHSASAHGAQRLGAPAGMNFDMLPAPSGWPRISDRREEIWSLVLAGDMPPSGSARATLGDSDWSFDPARGPEAERLPSLGSEEGKAVLRNWLASGAPVVTDTTVPVWARPPTTGTVDGGSQLNDWSAIYEQVIAPSCALAGCHDARSMAGGLALARACDAYRQLRANGNCGEPRVVPGNPDSLLVDKLVSDSPACGTLRMPPPPLPALDTEQIDAIEMWVELGASAAGCP